MAKTKISEFSTTPGNNTDINGINIAEGCAPSGINNAIRELMSDLKEWQSGAMDVYVIPQGTAAAPGIQLYGDLDTGLYGYAANQLGVAVGGASVGYFSSAGWVGNVVATTVDLTNIEVTNIKAKDGTTSISLADSTGIATFSKATVIETTDNTNAALRITQLGTGNALLVEDATNPDTTPTVIDQFGNVILGKDTRTSVVTGKAEIHSTSSENLGLTPSLGFYNWSATASSASHLTFRHYPSGTVGTLAANTSGDVLGRVVFLSYDGTNAFSASIIGVSGTGGANPSISYTAAGGHNFSSGVVSVSTQLNADNLRLDGNTISSTDTDGNIVISPNGAGDVQIDADTVRVGDSNANVTITTNGTGDLTLNTNSGTSSGYIQILDGANGNIGIVPDGTGIVYLSSSTVVTGNANPSTKITTLGTSDLTLDTNEGFESGSILIENGVNGDIIITPDGTGKTQISGTLDVTTIEATNIRAKDGTASIVLTDVSGAVDISKAVTFSTTTETIALGTSQTTGMFTVGGTAQTGTQTIGRSTKTHTLNLGTGATESGLTKTVNIGTGGVSTSTTAINIGSANGTTTTLNGTVTAATLNSTTIDTTNIEVTNIKAKDGTAALSIADSTGVVSVSTSLNVGSAGQFTVSSGGKVNINASQDTAILRQTSASSYAGLRIYNDQNSGSRALEIDYSGSAYSGAFLLNGPSGEQAAIATTGAYPLTLGTANTARAVITSGGQVNIGGNFTSTNNTLQVTGNAAIGYTTAAPTTGLIVAGNVGIGTDSPSSQLSLTEVTANTTTRSDQIRIQAESSGTTGVGFGANIYFVGERNGGTLQAMGRIGFGASTNTVSVLSSDFIVETANNGTPAERARITSSGSLELKRASNSAQNSVVFNTTVQDALTLDSSGNLGLGVTPSAYNNRGFDISSFVGLSQNSAGAATLAFNNFQNSAGNYIYKTTNAAARYDCGNEGGGRHAWFIAGSGTAGNTISFTQAMTLDASGNLGIGTTNPGRNLTINATIPILQFTNPTSGTTANDGLLIYQNGLNSYVSNQEAGSLIFETANTERARITSGGYFKASNTGGYFSPTGAYHELFNNAAEYIVRSTSSNASPSGMNVYYNSASPNGTGNPFLYCEDNSAQRAAIRSNGGLANYSANDVNLASDLRLKNTIEPMRSYYDVFKNINWVTWLYNDQTDDLKNHGVIAQELQELAPEFVCESNAKEAPEGEAPYLGIWEQDFKMAGMSVITELIKKIEKLEAEVAALKGA